MQVPDFPNKQKTVQKVNNLRQSQFPKKEGGGPGRYDHDHRFNGYFFYLPLDFFYLNITQKVATIIKSRSQIMTPNSSKKDIFLKPCFMIDLSSDSDLPK